MKPILQRLGLVLFWTFAGPILFSIIVLYWFVMMIWSPFYWLFTGLDLFDSKYNFFKP